MPATGLTLIATLLLVCLLLALLLRQKRQLKQQLAEHHALLHAHPDGLLLVDADGFINLHNNAAAQMLGNPNTPVDGTPLQSWLPQLSEPLMRQRILLPMAEKPQGVDVRRVATPNHGHAIVLSPTTPLHGTPMEDAERFKRSQYFASIGTWDWSIDTETLYWSEAIYGLFGFKVGEVIPSYELFCSCVHPDDREQVRAGELRCIESGSNHDEVYRVIWPDGSIHWLRETGNVVKDANGQAVKMMGVVRDISAEKASVSELQQLARHDPLTGLPNRLLLEEHVTHSLQNARSNASRVALVFIDLNGFKQINDEYGHAVGDQILVNTAQRLQQTLRGTDMVARLGGDEFVLVIEALTRTNSQQDDALLISEKILQRLSEPVCLGDTYHHVGTSLGIAMFPEHGTDIDSLFHIADQAMYTAKRNGNNQYYLGLSETASSTRR
jgi:diguanylate cyclase (GGDEF)-like protein/PAS domain S-box-containing protein